MFQMKDGRGSHLIFATAAERGSKQRNSSKGPSFLSVNHVAQRESRSEFGFIFDVQWKPEGQFESLPALTDKYALCFQHIFHIKRALVALQAFNAPLKTLSKLHSAEWKTGPTCCVSPTLSVLLYC